MFRLTWLSRHDPDMMDEICKRANCKARFTTTAWEGIFVALSQDQFDAVVSGVTMNDERRFNQFVLIALGESLRPLRRRG